MFQVGTQVDIVVPYGVNAGEVTGHGTVIGCIMGGIDGDRYRVREDDGSENELSTSWVRATHFTILGVEYEVIAGLRESYYGPEMRVELWHNGERHHSRNECASVEQMLEWIKDDVEDMASRCNR